MNTFRVSVKNKKSRAVIFLQSLYYTVPIGMFLTACNFLFESVRKHYFDWLIVLIPTVLVLISGNVFEMLQGYKKEQKVIKKKRVNVPKAVSYRITKPELVTS